MFSSRQIYEPEVWRSSFFEFEEIIRIVDSVDLVAPRPQKWYGQCRRIAMSVGKRSTLVLNPGIPKVKIDKYYDLFVAACDVPSELLSVSAAVRWKDHCRTSVCIMNELWTNEMPLYKSCIKILSKFDYVLTPLRQSVEPISKITGKPCSYLPLGVDAILFCPFPSLPHRFIDVLSYGRRSEQLHQTLVSLFRDDKLFYLYDTTKDLLTFDLAQHRLLRANILKRSRCSIVNPGKFDLPGESGTQSEIGARYFEGAAAGTIMIGQEPSVRDFKEIFNWPDAVVAIPREAAKNEVEGILGKLSMQSERVETARRRNVVESLLRHDWVYRWETVLKLTGLDPLRGLLERKQQLQNLSEMARSANLCV